MSGRAEAQRAAPAARGATVFISHDASDRVWASWLADRLDHEGVKTFIAGRDAEPGDVVLQRIEAALGRASTGLLLMGITEPLQPARYDEYAALLQAAHDRGLRLIPVLWGESSIDVTPLATGTVPIDLRSLGAEALHDRVRQLATVIRTGRATAGGAQDVLEAVRRERRRAPAPLGEPSFVVTFARTGTSLRYGHQLTSYLAGQGLPIWSISDLAWGDRWVQEIRDRIKAALGLLIVMSPQAQDADSITREILEGQRHGKSIFPVLVEGQPLFLLASSWYFDARGGEMPGAAELEHLHDVHDRLRGLPGAMRPANNSRHGQHPTSSWTHPTLPVSTGPARSPSGDQSARAYSAQGLRRLEQLLRQGELELADLMTTSLLLESAQRSDEGWLRSADLTKLELCLLLKVDRIWTQFTNGHHGFDRQQALFRQAGVLARDFPAVAHTAGWRTDRPRNASGPSAPAPRYHELVSRPLRDAFFPTLRNPQLEDRPGWYDRWRHTVITVHSRYREGSDK